MKNISHYLNQKNIQMSELSQLCQHHGISSLYVFGSVGRGEPNADSDVDLLVQFNDSENRFTQFMGAYQALTSLFGQKIDLVEFEGIKKKPAFEQNVRRDMVLIYAT